MRTAMMVNNGPIKLVHVTTWPALAQKIYNRMNWAAWQEQEDGRVMVTWTMRYEAYVGRFVECTHPGWIWKLYHDEYSEFPGYQE